MARVFVSHSSSDHGLARTVHGWLVDAGHEAFLDLDLHQGIRAGDEWQQRLHERLRRADALVCLVTQNHMGSVWCTAEVAIALSRGARVFPLLAQPGLSHPLLNSIQHVDLADQDQARCTLLAGLQVVDAGGGGGWPDDRSPFPGLRSFDLDERRVFFGRAIEVDQLAGLLRSPAHRAEASVLTVVGPSGCGKSSLVKAGLLPVIAEEAGWWPLPPVRPRTDPVSAFAREIAAMADAVGRPTSIPDLVARWDEPDGLQAVLDELLHAAPRPRRDRVLLVLDQLEEMLTQTPAPKRAHFAKLVGPVLGRQLSIVATLRLEFLEALLQTPELVDIAIQTYPLRPLSGESLSAVVRKPAAVAGITVDDDLVARLVADAAGNHALPLLGYTLAQMADGVTRGGRLSHDSFVRLGGVRGTMTRQADAALADAMASGGRPGDAVIAALLRLVTVDDEGNPTRWRATLRELPEDVVGDLRSFLDRRLLVTDEDDAGEVVVEVAHEAFLSAWGPLADAIARDAAALRARRHVEQAAVDWEGDERSSTRLWERGRLAAAFTDTGARLSGITPARWRRRVLVTKVPLSGSAREFLRASALRDRRRRARALVVLTTLLAVALGGLVALGIQLSLTEEQQRTAIARQLLTQAEESLARDPRRSLQIGASAVALKDDAESQAALARLTANTRYRQTLPSSGSSPKVRYQPGGNVLAVLGEELTLWDTSNAENPVTLAEVEVADIGRVTDAAFSGDGRLLVVGSYDGKIVRWDVSDPTRPHRIGTTLEDVCGPVQSIAIAADRQVLAEGCADGTVVFWDLAAGPEPQRIDPVLPVDGTLGYLSFAPTGSILAVVSDGAGLLWDTSSLSQPQKLSVLPTGPGSYFDRVSFAPDGRTAAAVVEDDSISPDNGGAVLWDVSDATQPYQIGAPLNARMGYVQSVEFSPDGSTVAVASGDVTDGVGGATTLWDVRDRSSPRMVGAPLATGIATMFESRFSPDGKTLATTSDFDEVTLWSVADPSASTTFRATGQAFSLAYVPEGRVLAVGQGDGGGSSGATTFWKTDGIGSPQQLSMIGDPGVDEATMSVAINPRGTLLAVGGYLGMLRFTDISDPSRPHLVDLRSSGEDTIRHISFSPDGRLIAFADESGFTVADTDDVLRTRRSVAAPRGAGALAFSPDGRILAVANSDGTVGLWDRLDGGGPQVRGSFPVSPDGAVSVLEFTADGSNLVAGTDSGEVGLWDVSDADHPGAATSELGVEAESAVMLSISPDGRTLCVGGDDGSVKMWDITDPGEPQELGPPVTQHQSFITDVAFTSDGGALASASFDGTVIVQSNAPLRGTDRDEALSRACRIMGGGLDHAAWAQIIPDSPYRASCDLT